ncbi:MAG: twin-arginine translocase TatA/TatE family subunit [Pseudomonadales bacterium]|jgi:sec-independent protein translocase protein TatA|nr:twin-arginine translocase TatA/TatE family subunit [Pseudomonadales bacterium]
MSFGITELIIILVIVLLLFGTTKLKSLGNDLGSAIKGFRTAVSDEKTAATDGDESAELAETQETKDPG